MKKIFNELRELAKKFGVNVKFAYLKNGILGTVCYKRNTIIINHLGDTRQELLSAFLHEYMHLYCYHNNIWKNYHKSSSVEIRLKTALKCERWIDKKASLLLAEYDSTVPYNFSYNDERAAEFLRDYYRNYYTKYYNKGIS